MASGIYKITNIHDGKSYVGSAVNIGRRWSVHRYALKRGNNRSVRLQRAWNKYGASSFEFSIIEIVYDVLNLIKREQFWMDAFGASGDHGYNTAPVAGSNLGLKASDETRKKMSLARAGRKMSPDQCARNGDIHRGKVLSQATRDKIAASRKMANIPPSKGFSGRRHSAESKAKTSAALKGRIFSAETLEKMAATKAITAANKTAIRILET